MIFGQLPAPGSEAGACEKRCGHAIATLFGKQLKQNALYVARKLGTIKPFWNMKKGYTISLV
jgi:hypothetical protein